MWRDFPNSCATDVTILFPNSHVKIYSSEKPFGCFSCDKIFSLNSHVKIHSNEKPLLRWQEIFLNSYYYGSCMLQLFVCKVQMLFQEFWKVKSLLVEQPNGYSSECILTREFGKFLVARVAVKWFLIWVCSDMFIQTREFCEFVVTLVAAKQFFKSVYFDLSL